jgi:glycerate 2-kinase
MMADLISTKTLRQESILLRMHQDAKAIFQAGLKAVDPWDAVHRHCRCDGRHLRIGNKTYDLTTVERLLVVGAGKATAVMAQAMEDLLADRISGGLISVKYHHTAPLKRIETIEAGHPAPDAMGVAAARRMFDLVHSAGARDLVIVLLSGGGSALMPLPLDGITLEDKQTASNLLIGSGASIHEINAVRKHISAIKGGRLARAAAPAATVALILSDVVGDDLDVIASGPTVPDASTFDQCRQIIESYELAERLPESISTRIQKGVAGEIPETPKPASQNWSHVQNLIIGSNLEAILAARQHAVSLGYNTLILSSRMEGETRVVARVHGAIAREILAAGHPLPAPACLLSGGETTVTLKGNGRGGRNQEFALAAALDIQGADHMVVLSGGTDGTDGPTDAAGALADGTTAQRARAAGLDIVWHLDNNDAYPLFQKLGDLFITGPTRTNVMDLRVLLVRAPEL